MPKINVLPKHMADLIAAGEVVERPASVIKELVENSIDAGASSVTVEIKRGGITYMRVTDDGCGIEREDIRNAFKSHATSKVLKEEDLLSIGTLGFRGEALASVAAVAKVEILTCTPDEEIGTIYKIEGSEEKLLDDAGCPRGTTIIVRDLFYNTPARMKFLKKDVTEGNAVAAVVDRIAMSHPEVSLRFIRDDKQTLVTKGDGNLQGTVYSVFGKDFVNTLVETEYAWNGIRVSGLVALPAAARANRSMQFFFLNGRLVKSITVQAALEQAFKNSIMVGKFPACVLNIETPLEFVDVNVHPSKTEVRFANEKLVFDAVYYAVKTVLDEKDRPNRIDLTKAALERETLPFAREARQVYEQTAFGGRTERMPERKPEMPVKRDGFWTTELPKEYTEKKGAEQAIENVPAVIRKQDQKPETEQKLPEPPRPFVRGKSSVNINIEYEDFGAQKKDAEQGSPVPERETKRAPVIEEKPEPGAELPQESIPDYRVIGEAFDTYIFVECEGKILLIDKHAAHERMLFEKLKAEAKTEAEDGGVKSQILLSPVAVTLSKEEYSAVLSNAGVLKSAGFDVGDFGAGTVIVREVPLVLMDDDIKALVEEMAGYLLSSRSPTPEKLDWLYHNTACRAAIKGGDKTTSYELNDFVGKLLANPQIRYCPHGRPVLMEMTRTELEKQFGRLGG